MATQFFATEYGQDLLLRIEKALKSVDAPKPARLRDAVRLVKANGKTFDEEAATNIEWISSSIAAEVEALEKTECSTESIDDLYATFYRFVSEYEITLPANVDLSMELRKFLEYPRENPSEFSLASQRQLRFADVSMPVQIMKRLLGSELLMNIRNIEKYSGEINKRFSDWNDSLRDQEQSVSTLHGALKEYETGFNFVGLHKGFDDLSKEKRTEVFQLRAVMITMGVLALAPIGAELWYLVVNLERFDQVKWALLAGAVPVLSFTVLLIYYFRLAVRSVDSAKSQLLQLELRKTLCRFIQSYIEYAKKAKEGGGESLGRFENVIFSGIVSTDEKIPATFDGVEQLAQLIKAAKS